MRLLPTLLAVPKSGYEMKFRNWLRGKSGHLPVPMSTLDFCVWSKLETKSCSISHKSIASLKASLVKEWNNILQETLSIAVEAVLKRLNAIVKRRVDVLNKIGVMWSLWFREYWFTHNIISMLQNLWNLLKFEVFLHQFMKQINRKLLNCCLCM